ncbi:MAG TPA: rRNA maturation RNase YbeY [Nitrococcus sp.]|nr:rRNA maturation RNase YbeY [Nitrococcus sp.]
MLEIDLQLASCNPDVPELEQFECWVAAALCGARDAAEIAIRVVDEKEGRELNAIYRGHDYATNILAFPAELPEGVDAALLGDLVICAPIVIREAVEQGKPWAAHWAHLVVHGVLHLLGYDHEEEAAATMMESRERAVLAELGYPDPYADSVGEG